MTSSMPMTLHNKPPNCRTSEFPRRSVALAEGRVDLLYPRSSKPTGSDKMTSPTPYGCFYGTWTCSTRTLQRERRVALRRLAGTGVGFWDRKRPRDSWRQPIDCLGPRTDQPRTRLHYSRTQIYIKCFHGGAVAPSAPTHGL